MQLVRSRWAGALALSLFAAAAEAQNPVPAPQGSPDQFTLPATQAPAPISAREYAGRRRALLNALGDGVVLALGATEPEMDYMPFAQNSPFRYLTGVVEPGAALVMVKRGGQVRETLFVLPRNPAREVWEGARLGNERAAQLTGMTARSVEGLMPALDSLLRGSVTLYTVSPLGEDGSRLEFLRPDQQLIQALRRDHPQIRVEDASDELFRIRSVKSPAELDMLRRSILITTLAHREAMRAVEPGMNEFEVQALIEATFRRNGAERPAFGSIVGSGPNSTTLHYRQADRFMQAGETLVMDIGSSYNGYAADVTRTVPVSGRFSPEQRQVYEVVLQAQKEAERQVRPGVSYNAITETAARVVSQGLARLGLTEGADATYDCGQGGRQKCPQYRLFYMHGLGHGIGLDVHDPEASYANYAGAFTVGSAFTIEPGIYVRADVLDYLPDTPANRAMIQRIRPVVQRYRNIGVRIEDDYFVTARGVERVTEHAPREIAEIEALMARESYWNRERRPQMVEWYRGITPR